MLAFWDAVRSGDVGQVASLAAERPELVTARDEQGATALQVAVYHGRRELAAWLVSNGGVCDVYSAAAAGTLDDRFRPDSSCIDEPSSDGFTALCLASAFAPPETVRTLLAWGADPEARSVSLGGVAPLHAAVFGRNSGAVEALLEAGATADARQQGGYTALMAAAQNGDSDCVALLLRYGADSRLKNDEGRSAADFALEAGLDLSAL
ncbi:MAG: ankyrin repeat domain-containing protein [Armatimonadetes bacterium]|nr:ankyrin repeat domain-containing protein [Armatimonadota bacterium]